MKAGISRVYSLDRDRNDGRAEPEVGTSMQGVARNFFVLAIIYAL